MFCILLKETSQTQKCLSFHLWISRSGIMWDALRGFFISLLLSWSLFPPFSSSSPQRHPAVSTFCVRWCTRLMSITGCRRGIDNSIQVGQDQNKVSSNSGAAEVIESDFFVINPGPLLHRAAAPFTLIPQDKCFLSESWQAHLTRTLTGGSARTKVSPGFHSRNKVLFFLTLRVGRSRAGMRLLSWICDKHVNERRTAWPPGATTPRPHPLWPSPTG